MKFSGKAFGLAVLIAVVGLGGWYWASPQLAVNAVSDAVRDRDALTLGGTIDFPTLRENLKAQFKVRLATNFAKAGITDGDLVENRWRYVANMVDSTVTPTGLNLLIDKARTAPSYQQTLQSTLKIRRISFDQFEASPSEQSDFAIVFMRHGLGWQITDFRLPFDLQTAFAQTLAPIDASPANPE